MSAQESSSDNTYIIDIEEGAETARLMHQDKLYTNAMGGLFPEQADLSYVEHILDLACGPGGWTIEVAFTYPTSKVIGVDINQTMVDYALAQAASQNIQNVTFEVMDIKQPLGFPDNSFDLVNARFITAFMDRTSWPKLLRECYRVLKPGGIARFTEMEWGQSNSPAAARLWSHLPQLLARQGRTFSEDGTTLGIAHAIGRLLKNAGFTDIERHAFLVDSSYDSAFHYAHYQNTRVSIALIKPYLMRSGILQEAEFEELHDRMLTEMMSEDFTSVAFGLTAWGMKPR